MKEFISKIKMPRTLMCALLSIILVISIAGCTADTINTRSTSDTTSAISSEVKINESNTDTNSGGNSDTDVTPVVTDSSENTTVGAKPPVVNIATSFNIKDIPAFSGKAYVAVNNNTPYFTESECTTKSYEHYSELDSLGRCGATVACVGKDIMPTEERGSIGQVKPSGWQTVKYDCVDGKYLYNRCHLIGFQLTGENANTKNLITGTRYMNVDGMLPFENMVADYVKETGNHVMYRVTPIFEGNNLLATGVLMEAYSVEDKGDGITFNVFCYNNQPQIEINYTDGSSRLVGVVTDTQKETTPKAPTPPVTEDNNNNQIQNKTQTYVLNTSTKKFHYPSCSSAGQIADKNKKTVTDSRDALISQGYSSCGRCHP